jgi:hypothetical protein
LAHRTNCIGAAWFVGAEVCHKRLFREAFLKWISLVFGLTPTVIASNGVDADRVLATNVA